MAEAAPDPLDDPFLGCAPAAFPAEARAAGGWPDPEATRRPYRLYEDALAEKHGRPRTSRSTDARSRDTTPPNQTTSEDA